MDEYGTQKFQIHAWSHGTRVK